MGDTKEALEVKSMQAKQHKAQLERVEAQNEKQADDKLKAFQTEILAAHGRPMILSASSGSSFELTDAYQKQAEWHKMGFGPAFLFAWSP